MAEVALDGVGKTYGGGAAAVSDVTLAVADGEFVVLVGPSGCGKSTLLRMIARLEEVTAGTIRIGGRVVNDVEPAGRDIAMVFQTYALYPHMTVRRNLAYGLKNRGLPRAEIDRRVAEAAALLEIGPFLDRQRGSSRAGSASAWPWAAPSFASRRPSCSTSRSPTSTPSSASRCEARSAGFSAASAPPRSTSPTTRWRR